MDKEKAKEYNSYLDDKYSECCTHPKQCPAIEAEIYKAALQWDVAFYASLRDGRATGLFETGFFESDIQETFKKLKEIIGQ